MTSKIEVPYKVNHPPTLFLAVRLLIYSAENLTMLIWTRGGGLYLCCVETLYHPGSVVCPSHAISRPLVLRISRILNSHFLDFLWLSFKSTCVPSISSFVRSVSIYFWPCLPSACLCPCSLYVQLCYHFHIPPSGYLAPQSLV